MKQSTSRICARCGHVNGACDCEYPTWVAWSIGFGKSIYELRKLKFRKVKELRKSLGLAEAS